MVGCFGGLQGYGAPRVGNTKKAASAPKQAAPPAPKALLQQHCQRMGFPAPRYEKLGYAQGDLLRYKVILPSAAPPVRGQQGGKVKTSLPLPPPSFPPVSSVLQADEFPRLPA